MTVVKVRLKSCVLSLVQLNDLASEFYGRELLANLEEVELGFETTGYAKEFEKALGCFQKR